MNKQRSRTEPFFFMIYLSLLILLTVFGFLFRSGEERKSLVALEEQRKTIDALLRAGFAQEAQRLSDQLPFPLKPEDAERRWTASLASLDFVATEGILKEQPTLQEEGHILQLVDALHHAGKHARAWHVLMEQKEKIRKDEAHRLAQSLLEETDSWPVSFSFVNGWVHEDMAVVQDEKGMTLLNGDGEVMKEVHYEEIVPVQAGFRARRGEIWVDLDKKGHFVSLSKPPKEKEEIAPSASHVLTLKEKQEGAGLTMGDEAIALPAMDQVTPVNHKGIAFFRRDGKWYQLRFDALRESRSFYRMKGVG